MRSDYHLRVPATDAVSRCVLSLVVLLLAAGCTIPRSVVAPTQATHHPLPTAEKTPTKTVETRYDVRGYREVTNPQVRHEAHAVYRSTRVPLAASDELVTVPRSAYPMPSNTPLPASGELAAELATQRSITADMRAIQTSIIETERRVQSQYATLVREGAEALKVREQLEAERARERNAVPTGTNAAPVDAPAGAAEVKW